MTESKKSTSEDVYPQIADAEVSYATGVRYNLNHEWEKARYEFDNALRLLSEIDISSQDEHTKNKIDMLLNEISYDYKNALRNGGNLSEDNATAIISLALDDDLNPETRMNLGRLLNKLPESPITAEYDYPVQINDKVKEKMVFFQTDAHDAFETWLSRSSKYLPMIKRIFQEEGIPLDLAYLPLVESGFHPKAYSWAKAMGLWQFIHGTGKMYGLNADWWVDDRCDPEMATRAAAKYLKTLYEMFDDWELALAGYNCGENRVKRTMKAQNTDNYWVLKLPKETRNYVPLFNAALIIAKNPEMYGFFPEYEKPLDYDIVSVYEPINLELAAEITGSTKKELEALNPQLLRWCTPPNQVYKLKVPPGRHIGFKDKYAQIPQSKKSVWQKHTVKKGESLSLIASKYGTSISSLVTTNKIRNRHKLSIGQTLLVPVKPGSSYASSSSKTKKSKNTSKDYSTKTYTVKKGDTSSEIAENHNISLNEFNSLNGLSKRSVIKPGQRLKVPDYSKKQTTYATKSSEKIKSVDFYIVRQGDTPLEIAVQHEMNLRDFLDLNDMNHKSVIYPGQKVKINGSDYIKEKTYHTVKSGESLSTIAHKHGVSVSDIVYWNGLSSKKKTIHPGDKITIIRESKKLAKNDTSSKKTVYKVKNGDSLWKISNKFDVSIEDIRKWNNKKNSSLSVGEPLVIYTDQTLHNKTSNGREVIHKVKNGDTLWAIAKEYNTTPEQIIALNSLSNPSKLKVGSKLKILAN